MFREGAGLQRFRVFSLRFVCDVFFACAVDSKEFLGNTLQGDMKLVEGQQRVLCVQTIPNAMLRSV